MVRQVPPDGDPQALTDQFPDPPGMLLRLAHRRTRQGRATFVAMSICVPVAATLWQLRIRLRRSGTVTRIALQPTKP
jgi:hypothetical protein